MKEENSFIKILDRAELTQRSMRAQMEYARRFYRDANIQAAYNAALNLEEVSERLVLLTRSLPAYTGCPLAQTAVEMRMSVSIPVEIGFTKEGWFSLRIPALLPKKSNGSADYVRSFLYPAMRDFFWKQPPVRFNDCVLIYRHVYDRDRPDRQLRDHDNIEVNMVSDIIALYVLPDDGPKVCSHYYCSASGYHDRTEVYVVPKGEFQTWLKSECYFPDKGVALYETKTSGSKNFV